MTDALQDLLPWSSRTPESAALRNPAFGGELIARSASEHVRLSGRALPLPLAFVVLPLALHPETRAALPKRADTAFASWVGENMEALALVPDRVQRLTAITREALLFLTQLRALKVGEDGVAPGERPLRLAMKPTASTDEVDDIRRTASFLGRWFGQQAQASAVLVGLGLRP